MTFGVVTYREKDATGKYGGGLTGAVLTSTGFQTSIAGGQYIVTIALAVFAFTTILGWSYYGERGPVSR